MVVTVVEAADLKASDPNGKLDAYNFLIMTTLGFLSCNTKVQFPQVTLNFFCCSISSIEVGRIA